VTDPLTGPGYRVQNNTHIYGVGQKTNKPILKLVGVRLQGALTVNAVIATEAGALTNGNIAITNLVLDCNAQSLTTNNTYPMVLQGIDILGTNTSYVGIDVINATAPDNGSENFIIALTCPDVPGLISTNNLIKECTVSRFYNTNGLAKCSAISLNKFPGGSNYSNGYIVGRVEDCTVTLNGFGGEFAYNATRTVSCVYSNNTANNANRGFNNDTGYNRGLVIQRNTFNLPTKSAYGILLVNDTSWARIYDNIATCDLNGHTVWECSGYQPPIPPNGPLLGVTNMLWDHNTILVTHTGSITTYGFTLQPAFVYDATHINVENNLLDLSLANAAPTNIGYYIRNTNALGPLGTHNLGWRYTPCRADFNQDANIDIVVQDANFDVATIFMTNGIPGAQISFTPFHPPGPWKVVGAGDIDRDGRTDLFLQNTDDLNIGYALLNDTYVKARSLLGINHFPGGTWHVVGTGDFNNDNKVDLLFQNASNDLAVWYLDGPNYVMAMATSPTNSGANWVAVGTGDFNNDGNDDILFQYKGAPDDGRLMVWFMNGVIRTNSMFLNPDGRTQPDYRVVSTGVFGTSGSSAPWNTDILFQHRTNGMLRMWFMSGTNSMATNDYSAPIGTYKVVGPR
jgi:hypothetical protein